MAVHIYRKLILEQYLDGYGHVNNASYLTILEEARWDWITSRGLGFVAIQSQGVGPVILEVRLRFLKEIRLREWIRIESRLVQWEGRIGIIEQKIFLEPAQFLATQAELRFGLFDLQSRKLIAPTDAWLRVFQD